MDVLTNRTSSKYLESDLMENVFHNKNILVVGGAGFVGNNLVDSLYKKKPRCITIVDNLLSAEQVNVLEHPVVHFIEGSITEDKILAALDEDLDYVFHLATYHGNQSSIHDPLADHENNTLTSLKLFHCLRDMKSIKKVVYSSAGCTVAEKTFDKANATDEDAPVSLYLDSPYQMSKIFGEFYANYYFMHYQLPVVKARFQNVYGPGEILGAGAWRGTPATVWRNVIPTFIYRALKRMPLIVENEGIATRDFIYVDDIVRGLMLCAATGRGGGVYNLASGIEFSIKELANKINEVTRNPAPISWGPKRAWDRSGKRFGSTEKAKKELGFQASVDIDTGLKNTIAWMQKNLDLIDQNIRKHDTNIEEFQHKE
jgi:UDP-glucose 4-epimerase